MSENGRKVQLNKEYINEVQLKDLLYHFVYRWKSILLVILVCAAALGGFQYLREKREISNAGRTNETAVYEQNLAAYKSSLEIAQNTADSTRAMFEEKKQYLEQSLVAQLDANDVWTAERRYIVTNVNGNVWDVVVAYTAALDANHDEQALTDTFGTVNLKYIRDIALIEGIKAEDSFTVTVLGATEEEAAKRMAYVAQKIEEAGPRAQAVAAHTLVLVGDGVFRTAFKGVTDKKYQAISEIVSFENVNKNAQKTLNDLINQGEPAKPAASGSSVKKWIVIGAVLGLLGIIALYLITFVLHGKVRKSAEISGQYGVPVFGETNKSCARKPGKGFNRVLEKFEFQKDSRTDDQVFENAAALIREKKADGSVLLTGTVKEETLAKVKDALAQRLGKDTELEIRANFPTDTGTVEEACRAGSVVWVEERFVSRCEKVRRAAEVLEASDANVIGAILV